MVLGLAGLLIGRLGETTWAPETERTATVDLSDPGPAVVIDPGVLYVGGTEGDVKITADADVSVITASNDDIDSYLDGVKHTQVTGLSDWSTLKTETVDGDGDDSISDPTSSDLWRSVKTSKSPTTIDIADFYAEETSTDPQPYRAILLVTDGTKPGADSISITWPVDEKNEWVPFAYAAGATLIIVGLVMLVVSFGSARRERERAGAGEDSEELPTESDREAELEPAAGGTAADSGSGTSTGSGAALGTTAGLGAAGTSAAGLTADAADEESEAAPTHEHESVDAWQLGDEQAPSDPSAAESSAAESSTADPSAEPETDVLDRVDDEPADAPAAVAAPQPDGPAGNDEPATDAPAAEQLGTDGAATEQLSADEPATEQLSADDPAAEQLSGEPAQRPVTAPIPVGGSDGSAAGHDDAEGSEEPTEVIDRIEEPIAGPGEDASAALPRRTHRHRAATPEPESGENHHDEAQHEGPEHGTDTEEEQR